MAAKTQTMVLAKETKGTVVYNELEEQAGETPVRTLYVAKRDARELGGGEFPKRITLTIEAE